MYVYRVFQKKRSLEYVKQIITDADALITDADALIDKNDIIIGNYRMQRDTPADAWTVTEVAQMSSVKAWHPLFLRKEMTILYIATCCGWNFYTGYGRIMAMALIILSL